jgi:hypothetical protein
MPKFNLCDIQEVVDTVNGGDGSCVEWFLVQRPNLY